MPSPKMLEQRERELMLKPRTRILQAGPTAAELAPRVVTTNRSARLAVETTLTRAQRMELREKRRLRKHLGYDPAQPKWAKPKSKTVGIAELAAMLEQDGLPEPPQENV